MSHLDDIEAAVLSGGRVGFEPLAGVLRGARPPLNSAAVVAAGHQLDRAAIALDRSAAARVAVVAYVVVLHLVLVL